VIELLDQGERTLSVELSRAMKCELFEARKSGCRESVSSGKEFFFRFAHNYPALL